MRFSAVIGTNNNHMISVMVHRKYWSWIGREEAESKKLPKEITIQTKPTDAGTGKTLSS